MKQQKEIIIDGYSFLIEYNEINTPLDKINVTNCGQLILVNFIPKSQLTEYQCIEIFDIHERELLNEIKIIVDDNKDFYDNFKVSFNFNRRTANLYREFNQVFIISMQVYLKIEIK